LEYIAGKREAYQPAPPPPPKDEKTVYSKMWYRQKGVKTL
jgi:hypothetical protein